MFKICIFAGTTEGRKLTEFLSSQPVSVTVCVATEYGEALLPTSDNVTISAERLPVDEIIQLLSNTSFDLVIDATHPYATAVTKSIKEACQLTKTEYVRLVRDQANIIGDALYFPTMQEAADYLEGTEGNIFLTTGSKDLAVFSQLTDFADRVYARVLPMQTSLEACHEAGLKPSHIIAMQGPFSAELNLAMLQAVSASYFVTKESGDAGGFAAKIAAAHQADIPLLIIGRPNEDEGLSFAETVKLLCSRFNCQLHPKIRIVGIGPGSRMTMTKEAVRAIEEADCLIGAARMLEAVAVTGKHTYAAIAAADIAQYIASHPEYRNFTVLMSGDTGFFSGAKKLISHLADYDVEVLPGVSSLAYLCAKIKTSYEDIRVISLHGRQYDIMPDIRAHKRIFVLLDNKNSVKNLCSALVDAGLGNVRLSVGERLSYADEKITQGTAAELVNGDYEALSVALIENACPDAVVTHGLPDEAFLRHTGETVVPMTKSEVRSICLSKLQLTNYSICWDIGAGTGSVAIEMARQVKEGTVYAIECNSVAIELLYKNKAHHAVENLFIIEGNAPKICKDLPAPDCAFIGGSSGKMKQIIKLLLAKNPAVRIVATAITLESVAELTACLKEFSFAETEVVSVQIARDRKAGQYHLMTGQNPIYIFTMQGGGAKC